MFTRSATYSSNLNRHDYRWIEHFHPDEQILRGRAYLFAKRVIDLVIVMSLFVAWFPLFCLIALLIKLQSPKEPVFFIQNRTGKDGRRFRMYKFRTMVANADELKQRYAHLNELKWPDFKITNDPRITPIGKILRKTSLDELPQLFNVLKNDMSLVGPRPTSFGPNTYALWQTERLNVQPGVTGLWQVVGRGTSNFDERLRMDIAYIEHRCLSLDLYLLFQTFIAVIKEKGAS